MENEMDFVMLTEKMIKIRDRKNLLKEAIKTIESYDCVTSIHLNITTRYTQQVNGIVKVDNKLLMDFLEIQLIQFEEQWEELKGKLVEAE